jgi:hypothetical protein
VRPEGISQWKSCRDLIGNLPACTAVPQPTALRRTPQKQKYWYQNICNDNLRVFRISYHYPHPPQLECVDKPGNWCGN